MPVKYSMELLPPANEVWGKVICLHLSVILSTGGCLVSGGCLVGGMRCLVPGGANGGDPRTATAAGGTHPTGMHSCLLSFHRTTVLIKVHVRINTPYM